MIFSIIVAAHRRLQPRTSTTSRILHPPFLLGLIAGGAVIYWFTGASTQAVSTGAYRAVEFIKANIKLEGVDEGLRRGLARRSSKSAPQYAQKGMFNIFLVVFFCTLAFAFFEPYFFIGYLISIALFGLFQAHLHGQRRRSLGQRQEDRRGRAEGEGHRRCTTPASSATPSAIPSRTPRPSRMNPIIKFTTLFGLLAVELAVKLEHGDLKAHWRPAS